MSGFGYCIRVAAGQLGGVAKDLAAFAAGRMGRAAFAQRAAHRLNVVMFYIDFAFDR